MNLSQVRKLTESESGGLLVNIHTNEFLQRHVYQSLSKMAYLHIQGKQS